MPLLAKGSFGCIYSPSLRCESPPSENFNYENKISKIGKNDIIDEEFKKYRFIELADKKSKYYLGKPIKCKPDPNIHKFELFNPSKGFKNCPFFTHNRSINFSDYSLLILDSGGITLKQFISDINSKYDINTRKSYISYEKSELFNELTELLDELDKLKKSKKEIKNEATEIQQNIIEPYSKKLNELETELNELKQIESNKMNLQIHKEEIVKTIEYFLIDIYKLFQGIDAFLKSSVIHFDIKFNNIVYDWKLRRMSYIDFGEMRSIPKIIKESKSPENQVDYKEKSMWYRPPEIRIYNINEFQRVIKNEENKKDELNNVINETTGDILDYDDKPNLEDISDEDIYYQYKAMIETLDETKYDELLEKSLQTFDSYSLGATIFYLLHDLDSIIPINKDLLNDIIKLSKKMINWNVFERITIKEAMHNYKAILDKYGLGIIGTDTEKKITRAHTITGTYTLQKITRAPTITRAHTITGVKSKKQTKRVKNKRIKHLKPKSYRTTAKFTHFKI